MSQKRIHIVSDGTPIGTQVFDAEGNKIESGISAIEWSISAGGKAEAKITFIAPTVELVGEREDG